MFNSRVMCACVAIGLLAPLGAAHADAASLLIHKERASDFESSHSPRLAVNTELGRAWVELERWSQLTESYDYNRISVPGLSYDAEARQVVFESNGKRVACANVKPAGRWIFRHDRLDLTGNCRLSLSRATLPVDDGFLVYKVPHLKLHLQVLPQSQG